MDTPAQIPEKQAGSSRKSHSTCTLALTTRICPAEADAGLCVDRPITHHVESVSLAGFHPAVAVVQTVSRAQ